LCLSGSGRRVDGGGGGLSDLEYLRSRMSAKWDDSDDDGDDGGERGKRVKLSSCVGGEEVRSEVMNMILAFPGATQTGKLRRH
jgi:hypothetical protein